MDRALSFLVMASHLLLQRRPQAIRLDPSRRSSSSSVDPDFCESCLSELVQVFFGRGDFGHSVAALSRDGRILVVGENDGGGSERSQFQASDWVLNTTWSDA